MTDAPEATVTVHHRGDHSVDGILRLIELATRDGEVEEILTVMCREIAKIAECDVASAYVRTTDEQGDLLVMRGNHGFPASAIGTVSLRLGEGIVGLVAECMRPVSAAVAANEREYKYVPGLGEEQFPAFLGIPLLGGGRVVGVLALQRRRREAFSDAHVALATALGAPLTLAIERHQRTTAPRSARLAGRIIVSGIALGRAVVVPTATALIDQPTTDLERGYARMQEDLDRARRRVGVGDPIIGRMLDQLALLLMDQRLRDRIVEEGRGGAGLAAVARDYAKVRVRAKTSAGSADNDAAHLEERAQDIEDLCVLIHTSALPRPSLAPGAVWIAERLGGLVALIAVTRGAGAIVLDGNRIAPVGRDIARIGNLPVIAGVTGVFSWARPGDLIAVQGGEDPVDTIVDGAVQVNPPASTVERLRSVRPR